MEACNKLAGDHARDERFPKHRLDPIEFKCPGASRKDVKLEITCTKASYNSAISACEVAKEWQQAFATLVSMKIQALTPDEISFNSAISAAEKAGQWEHAIQLLLRMSAEATAPSTISYNAAISACAKPGEWEAALALAAVMDETGVTCDEITFNCLSNACEKAGCWQLALDLLQKQSPTKVGSLVKQICSSVALGPLGLETLTPAEASQVVWRLAKLSRLGASVHSLAEAASQVVVSVGIEAFELQELGAVMWSLARLGVSGALMPRLSRAAFQKMDAGGARGLNIRTMANLAWALSMPDTDVAGTLGQIQNELARRSVRLAQSVSRASWTEFVTAALAILYAAHFAGQLLPNAAQTVRSALVSQGRRFDKARIEALAGHLSLGEGEPWAQELPGALLVRKPAHWQVDERDATYDVEQFSDNRGLLSFFVRSLRPGRQYPIVRDTTHQRGFLHRLDVPSSGLILVATSFEGFYDLKFQLATGLLTRAYVILCHGLLSPSRAGVRSPINWLSVGPDSNRASSVQDSGRPSQTYMRLLARAFQGKRALSLVHVKIMTGRRHQIRVHTSFVGHPTLADGKYSSTHTYMEDLVWCLGTSQYLQARVGGALFWDLPRCPRNFLHRHELVFEVSGRVSEAFEDSTFLKAGDQGQEVRK